MSNQISHENVLELLNLLLQNHPRYESWMRFDSIVYTTSQPLTLRYRMPASHETSLDISEIKSIYNETAISCIHTSAAS